MNRITPLPSNGKYNAAEFLFRKKHQDMSTIKFSYFMLEPTILMNSDNKSPGTTDILGTDPKLKTRNPLPIRTSVLL